MVHGQIGLPGLLVRKAAVAEYDHANDHVQARLRPTGENIVRAPVLKSTRVTLNSVLQVRRTRLVLARMDTNTCCIHHTS